MLNDHLWAGLEKTRFFLEATSRHWKIRQKIGKAKLAVRRASEVKHGRKIEESDDLYVR